MVTATVLIFSASAFGQTLVWDAYTDTEADSLRIYQSTTGDAGPWTAIVNSIPTDMIASDVPNGPDNTRVHYMMRAHSSGLDVESSNSDTVSFFWTTGGGGSTGPAGIGGIRLLDCTEYDGVPDDGSDNWDICAGRHTP